jgi:hypothetical protein
MGNFSNFLSFPQSPPKAFLPLQRGTIRFQPDTKTIFLKIVQSGPLLAER